MLKTIPVRQKSNLPGKRKGQDKSGRFHFPRANAITRRATAIIAASTVIMASTVFASRSPLAETIHGESAPPKEKKQELVAKSLPDQKPRILKRAGDQNIKQRQEQKRGEQQLEEGEDMDDQGEIPLRDVEVETEEGDDGSVQVTVKVRRSTLPGKTYRRWAFGAMMH